MKKYRAVIFIIFREFNLCRPLLMITLYYKTKTPVIRLRHQSVFGVGKNWITNLLYNYQKLSNWAMLKNEKQRVQQNEVQQCVAIGIGSRNQEARTKKCNDLVDTTELVLASVELLETIEAVPFH